MIEPRLPVRRHHRRRRLRWFLAFVVALVVVLAVGAGLAAARYLPMLDAARQLKASLVTLASEASTLGIDVDRPKLEALRARFDDADRRLTELSAEVDADPLIRVLGDIGLTRGQVEGGHRVFGAAREMMDGTRVLLDIGDRYVAIRETHASDPSRRQVLADLVQLMATTQTLASQASTDIQAARHELEQVPAGLFGPLEEARVLMRDKADQYVPLLQAYVEMGGVIPAILGWPTPARYLILAQDNLELRPTGGLIGTYGILRFDRGTLTERTFKNIYAIDYLPGHAYVQPPAPLEGHLLGHTAWQLADSGWSPDFPTAAQDAIRLYELESGDRDIAGVIAITPLTIDKLLAVTGPITVPGYDVTMTAGTTGVRSLEQVELHPKPGEDRKAFLNAFAGILLDSVLALPPSRWPALLEQIQTMGSERDAAAWFRDPATQAFVVGSGGWSGAVRQDQGDFVYAVDANVGPVSKLNLVTERRQTLDVRLDEVGNAHDDLILEWVNHLNDEVGKPYDYLRALQFSGNYGNFVRLVMPARSRLEGVSGGGVVAVNGPDEVAQVGGRMAVGNYLMIPPGTSRLHYAWTSPYPADADRSGGIYRLTVQKQPGTPGDALTITITVPPGARIVEATPGLQVAGERASLSTRLVQDVSLFVRYTFG